MSTDRPVVVYGATGYTGRLVIEYLREYQLPFIAAGRDADRIRAVVDAVPGIDTVPHDVVAVDHTVESLSAAFDGAQVVCNTVGPFAELGHEVAEACLATGAHYLDTTGEQNWVIAARDRWGAKFDDAGLLLSPGIAQMYTTGEIAAQIALEQPGLDSLDILVLWKGFPTYASTQTIFTNLLEPAHYLEANQLVPWEVAGGTELQVPGQHELALSLPWGGTSHPVWFQQDHRVANCRVQGGLFDRNLMNGIIQMAAAVGTEISKLPPEEQGPALKAEADKMQSGMPPRENQRVNRSLDSVHATGPLGRAHVLIRGACNYKQTGLMQAYGAYRLVHGAPLQTGFASGCQAFGHRELLGELQSFGLAAAPEITRV
ncbi:MAG: DUF5938 domain-containing protein [Solirubrobacteraceae bacterium]|nr:DUF5938 domain-containing protein [Solirubrobacteraceae bacterium]